MKLRYSSATVAALATAVALSLTGCGNSAPVTSGEAATPAATAQTVDTPAASASQTESTSAAVQVILGGKTFFFIPKVQLPSSCSYKVGATTAEGGTVTLTCSPAESAKTEIEGQLKSAYTLVTDTAGTQTWNGQGWDVVVTWAGETVTFSFGPTGSQTGASGQGGAAGQGGSSAGAGVNVDSNGVDVHAPGANVNVDENGVDVQAPGAGVSIDENGVNVNMNGG